MYYFIENKLADRAVERETDDETVMPTETVTQEVTTEKVIVDFSLPDIGVDIKECEVVDWLVAVGDFIVEDQPVCDVMTDKALVQIPSKYTGKIIKLYHQHGDIAIVRKALLAIEIDR
jgi:2-oxoisovalerate dehydrogenase E2 component (dihydrolipoyl transacylase)